MSIVTEKKADLAGPGVGDYTELERILPNNYHSLLSPKETQQAIFAAKNYVEENLCRKLNLMMVTVPLIVDAESGVNDYLDRDGSRTPIQFHITNDYNKHPVDAQVVQAATKWKRVALQRFGMTPGEGLCTDMRAVRKDYFLDHDHSAYVDQWDWEKSITADQRNLDYLKATVRAIWQVLVGAERHVLKLFPKLADSRYPNLPEDLRFLHAEDLLDMFPICRENGARRRSCKNIPRSSSLASAGRSKTGTRTKCAQPTTTTGLRRRARMPDGRRMA